MLPAMRFCHRANSLKWRSPFLFHCNHLICVCPLFRASFIPFHDLGALMLSMHSAREFMAVADVAAYVRLLGAHFAT